MLSTNKVKTELFPYSKGVTTADSSAYLLCIHILDNFHNRCPSQHNPRSIWVSFRMLGKCVNHCNMALQSKRKRTGSFRKKRKTSWKLLHLLVLYPLDNQVLKIYLDTKICMRAHTHVAVTSMC